MQPQSASSSSQSQSDNEQHQHIPSHDISNLSPSILFNLAEQKYHELDYTAAEEFYTLALGKDPHNQTYTLCYAHLLKILDRQKEAKEILQRSLKVMPSGVQVHKRLFQMGEVSGGEEAIRYFQRGIQQAEKVLGNPFRVVEEVVGEKEVVNKKRKHKKGKKTILNHSQQPSTVTTTKPQTRNQQLINQTKTMIAQAYASIAEICMSDLLDQPAAQKVCINALNKGEMYDRRCKDLQLQWANYLLFKDDEQGARGRLMGVFDELIGMRKGEPGQGQQKALPYELALQTSKYLIQTENFSQSAHILSLINQDVSSSQEQILYLLAYCNFREENYVKCEEWIQEYEGGRDDDKEYDQEVEDAMKQLKVELGKRKKGGQGQGDETGGNGQQMDVEGDADWEDLDQEDK